MKLENLPENEIEEFNQTEQEDSDHSNRTNKSLKTVMTSLYLYIIGMLGYKYIKEQDLAILLFTLLLIFLLAIFTLNQTTVKDMPILKKSTNRQPIQSKLNEESQTPSFTFMQFLVGLENEIYKIEDRESLEKTRNDLLKGLKELHSKKIETQDAKIKKYLQICELNMRFLHRYDDIYELIENEDTGTLYHHCFDTLQEIEKLPNKYEMLSWIPEQFRDILRELPNPDHTGDATIIRQPSTQTYRILPSDLSANNEIQTYKQKIQEKNIISQTPLEQIGDNHTEVQTYRPLAETETKTLTGNFKQEVQTLKPRMNTEELFKLNDNRTKDPETSRSIPIDKQLTPRNSDLSHKMMEDDSISTTEKEESKSDNQPKLMKSKKRLEAN